MSWHPIYHKTRGKTSILRHDRNVFGEEESAGVMILSVNQHVYTCCRSFSCKNSS